MPEEDHGSIEEMFNYVNAWIQTGRAKIKKPASREEKTAGYFGTKKIVFVWLSERKSGVREQR